MDFSLLPSLTEMERDRYLRNQALAWIKASPGDWARLAVRKLLYGFGLWPLWLGWRTTFLLGLPFLLILCLSIPGWLYLIRAPGLHRLLLTHLAAFITITIVFFGLWRYRHPFEGSFILAAVLTLTTRRIGTPPPR